MFLLKPRWSDLDAYSHVNNVTWLEYLQEARVEMLFVHASARGAEGLAQGVGRARRDRLQASHGISSTALRH